MKFLSTGSRAIPFGQKDGKAQRQTNRHDKAFEDGTDTGFRNVGQLQFDAGEIPRRKYTKFKSRRKSEIKNKPVTFLNFENAPINERQRYEMSHTRSILPPLWESIKTRYSQYAGCFTTLGHNCRRWFSRALWWKKNSYKPVSDFGQLRSYGHFLIPVHAFVWTTSYGTTGGVMHLVSLVANFSQLQTVQFPLSRHLGGLRGRWGWVGTRAVHNRAAACVVASGGIFENQL